jgi:hypothetical protein
MPANYVLLERIELNASAASVTFSNIPQSGYTDLKVVVSARTTNAATSDTVLLNLNGLTTNQSSRRLQGDGSATSSNSYSLTQFVVNGNTATSNTFGSAEIYIPNYNSTTTYKAISIDSIREGNETTTNTQMWAGLWSSNSAITSIQIAGQSTNFLANSTFSLYGLAALGTTPVIAPKATGGDIVSNDGTYWYHAFLTTGAFVPTQALTCDALVVAGGGGAGIGGGGGGGLLGFSNQSFIATNYTVTVGAGGASSPTNGSNSQLGALTAAIGGGKGGGQVPGDGGSGGGSPGDLIGVGPTGGNGSRVGNGTAGQGNNGGSGYWGNPYATGGGGGAGAVGSNYNSGTGQGGNGGAGATFNTTVGGSAGPYSFINAMGAATLTGQLSGGNYYYAGGGGGNKQASGGTATSGGLGGGGGGGGDNQNGVSGTANTGGGGGPGGYWTSTPTTYGAGGSGIVIIRYPIA